MNYYQIITAVRKLLYGEAPASFSDISGTTYYDIVDYVKNGNSDFMRSKGFQFRRKKTTFDTVVNQQEYVNFYGNIRHLYIATSTQRQRICFYPDIEKLLICNVIDTGMPRRYGILNNKIVLHPVPDDEYTINVIYDTDKFVKQPFSVDAESASGQKKLYLSSTTGILAGDTLLIEPETIREEIRVVDTITAGNYVTLTENLTYTHPVGSNNVYLEKDEFVYETDEPNFPSKFHVILEYEALKRLNFHNPAERDKYIGLAKQVYKDIARESRGSEEATPRFQIGD